MRRDEKFFCLTRRKFAVISYIFQEFLTKSGEKIAVIGVRLNYSTRPSFANVEERETYKLLILPANYVHDNNVESVLVMYVNPEYIGFNSHESNEGFLYAQNFVINNIKSAKDVLIKRV